MGKAGKAVALAGTLEQVAKYNVSTYAYGNDMLQQHTHTQEYMKGCNTHKKDDDTKKVTELYLSLSYNSHVNCKVQEVTHCANVGTDISHNTAHHHIRKGLISHSHKRDTAHTQPAHPLE